jgi:hypothetical protein
MMNRISLASLVLHTDGPGLASWVVDVVTTVVVGVGDDGKTVVGSLVVGISVVDGA